VSRKTTRRSAAKSKPQGKAVIRGSIGPVEDLESYVKADWWRDIFNANYLRTDGDVVEDPDITEGEIDAFLELVDVEQGACILDLCCGQGRHLLELARRVATLDAPACEIYTNGTLLSDARLDELAPHRPSFAFSFYSHRQEIHEAITRTPNSHELTIQAIRRTLSRGLPVRVSIVVMREVDPVLPVATGPSCLSELSGAM